MTDAAPSTTTLDTLRVLGVLAAGRVLDTDDARGLFEALLAGQLDPAQIASALTALRVRGPTATELATAARVMRSHVTPVPYTPGAGESLIDTCGTGGAPKTFNVSTAAALVAASIRPPAGSHVARIVVAKHGNRSRTGRGSAEVLAALGVNVDASPDVQARCLRDVGVCFCFAIHHHPAMKHAAGPRRSLGFPTIFNLLGPLTNPAGATRQLIGVYAPELVGLVAAALAELGATRALVVHADDGLDELSITAPGTAALVERGSVRTLRVDAGTLGLHPAAIDTLLAGSVQASADIIGRVLAGQTGPARDMVVLSAAAAACVSGAFASIQDAIDPAREAIDSGRASATLAALVHLSRSP